MKTSKEQYPTKFRLAEMLEMASKLTMADAPVEKEDMWPLLIVLRYEKKLSWDGIRDWIQRQHPDLNRSGGFWANEYKKAKKAKEGNV